MLDNISECDVNLACFSCLSALVGQEQSYATRNSLLKRWFAIVSELAYKKEYLECYMALLHAAGNPRYAVPHRLRYALAIFCLELTRNVQQQYTRFLLYNGCCRNMVAVSRRAYLRNRSENILLNIFQYGWFIDRINQENDLFKS